MPGPRKLIVATSNAHKTAEIAAVLGSSWEVGDLSGMPPETFPEEDGDTFAANALIKARAAAATHLDSFVLADDSGLVVDALGGEPGIFSARYAGEGASDAENRTRLLQQLREGAKEALPWTARFRCALALIEPGKAEPRIFEGAVEGRIVGEESGEGGFGYDPIFQPDGHDATFGVLPASLKNAISHRARALEGLVAYLGR